MREHLHHHSYNTLHNIGSQRKDKLEYLRIVNAITVTSRADTPCVNARYVCIRTNEEDAL
jgi:hypothetical protein